MLERLSTLFNKTYAFYFDISFEETLRRHQFKADKRHEFGEKEMKEWWLDHDTLDITNETLIPGSLTEAEVLALIINTTEKSDRS